MDDVSCTQPGRLYLLDSGTRSFLATLATHILAGEIDTVFPSTAPTPIDNISATDASLVANPPLVVSAADHDAGQTQPLLGMGAKISWLLRYFNPVNLCWRYYSMLAFRFTAPSWGPKQLALINFEVHPFHPPTPYIVGDLAPSFVIKRLEISGFLSSQGLLSFLAAYQGLSAIYFILAPQTIGCLPTLSKPLAILGLFRAMVTKWVASKVYIEPYPYPSRHLQQSPYPSNKVLPFCWAFICLCIVMLCISPFITHSEFVRISEFYVEFVLRILYQYTGISIFLFHTTLLLHGPHALANRILFFDHWTYKLQTWGFYFLLAGTFFAGLLDFVMLKSTDFLMECVFFS
ncbi:hypothetical protein GOP47_0018278 [Adiantum capillus-veneris]|uniref:Uncharacterized protein n=1 Tax=Adiantum capillus-veneris TaxID=13818 RepID=A0A9D4ZBQ2_ADICA|nr:hypothetical protein GOP47_0018278 [Adiantum capillus-veneris]